MFYIDNHGVTFWFWWQKLSIMFMFELQFRAFLYWNDWYIYLWGILINITIWNGNSRKKVFYEKPTGTPTIDQQFEG